MKKYREMKKNPLSEKDKNEIFSRQNFKQKTIIIFQSLWLIAVYNMYSRIVLNTFLLLKCVQLDDSPYLYLQQLPDVICWHSYEHIKLLLGVLLPCLSIWCIAWPIYLFIKLYKKKENINRLILSATTSPITIGKSIFLNNDDILNTEKIFKYLTLDYKPEAYYWEIYFYAFLYRFWLIPRINWIQFRKQRCL